MNLCFMTTCLMKTCIERLEAEAEAEAGLHAIKESESAPLAAPEHRRGVVA